MHVWTVASLTKSSIQVWPSSTGLFVQFDIQRDLTNIQMPYNYITGRCYIAWKLDNFLSHIMGKLGTLPLVDCCFIFPSASCCAYESIFYCTIAVDYCFCLTPFSISFPLLFQFHFSANHHAMTPGAFTMSHHFLEAPSKKRPQCSDATFQRSNIRHETHPPPFHLHLHHRCTFWEAPNFFGCHARRKVPLSGSSGSFGTFSPSLVFLVHFTLLFLHHKCHRLINYFVQVWCLMVLLWTFSHIVWLL